MKIEKNLKLKKFKSNGANQIINNIISIYEKVKLIAELCQNHFGDLSIVKK